MLGRGWDIVCVRAVNGGAALGNEGDDLARKRAVEAGATTLAGRVEDVCAVACEGSEDGCGGCEGADGMGSANVKFLWELGSLF